jgi:hypothetical protein
MKGNMLSKVLKMATMLVAAMAFVALSAAPAFAQVEKVTICHKPGTPAEQTKEVPAQAVDGHLGHGDTLGKCEGGGDGGGGVKGDPGNDGRNGVNGDDGDDGDFLDLSDDFFDALGDLDGAEQNADSGNVDQIVSIGGGNDNSNLCVAPQLAANTGNVQNSTSGSTSGGDDFGLDSDASISVNPVLTTNCDQALTQTATTTVV